MGPLANRQIGRRRAPHWKAVSGSHLGKGGSSQGFPQKGVLKEPASERLMSIVLNYVKFKYAKYTLSKTEGEFVLLSNDFSPPDPNHQVNSIVPTCQNALRGIF